MEPSAKELVPLLYKISNAFALPIEQNFSPEASLKFAKDYSAIPIVLVSLYLIMVYWGPKIMNGEQRSFENLLKNNEYLEKLLVKILGKRKVDKEGNKKGFEGVEVKLLLASWNALLSLFSFIGMFIQFLKFIYIVIIRDDTS